MDYVNFNWTLHDKLTWFTFGKESSQQLPPLILPSFFLFPLFLFLIARFMFFGQHDVLHTGLSIWDCTYCAAYCLGIKQIITKFSSMSEITPTLKWELFKFECRRFSMCFGKQQLRDQNKAYADHLKEFNDILNIPIPSNEDKVHLHSLREELDLFFQTKAGGAFIRSRARWLEHGEKKFILLF